MFKTRNLLKYERGARDRPQVLPSQADVASCHNVMLSYYQTLENSGSAGCRISQTLPAPRASLVLLGVDIVLFTGTRARASLRSITGVPTNEVCYVN